ncbi:MAG: CPBP family intramembrane metalloprotease [Piscirickettsiaceae bacterium]|nr:MAG: CPBP family intramembrane metalloprotease [Piscirickettsiaceae bacterium]
MKASLFFLVYFVTAALIAAFIAYPLFELAQNDAFQFESWVTRSALLLLMVGIIPTLKYFQLSARSIGHNSTIRSFFSRFFVSFVIGLGILSVVIFLLIYLDIRTISNTDSLSFKLILKAFFAGLVVALIEESLFRGLFFTLSKKWHGVVVAIVISSFFYALLHFIKPIEHIDNSALHWLSGVTVIMNAFSGVLLMDVTDFLALFVVGTLLALVRYRTGSLAYCIGLHASWVFLIKICKDLTDKNPQSDWLFLTGHYDGIIGLLSVGWLLIVIAVYVTYINKSTIPSPA